MISLVGCLLTSPSCLGGFSRLYVIVLLNKHHAVSSKNKVREELEGGDDFSSDNCCSLSPVSAKSGNRLQESDWFQ